MAALPLVTAPPLGRHITKVYGDDRKAPGDRVFLPVEHLIYRLCHGFLGEPGLNVLELNLALNKVGSS